MFNLLKLTTLALLQSHKITDEHSCRAFLQKLVLLAQSLAAKTKTPIDDTLLKPVEFILDNNALFEYVYRLIVEQFQTPEILFESTEEKTITELVATTASSSTSQPGAIDPVVIISIITKIISIINTIKNR